MGLAFKNCTELVRREILKVKLWERLADMKIKTLRWKVSKNSEGYSGG